jgi:hypothetical protein
MKNDEATAAKLWDEATAETIGRTQKSRRKESPAKAPVIFGYPKREALL